MPCFTQEFEGAPISLPTWLTSPLSVPWSHNPCIYCHLVTIPSNCRLFLLEVTGTSFVPPNKSSLHKQKVRMPSLLDDTLHQATHSENARWFLWLAITYCVQLGKLRNSHSHCRRGKQRTQLSPVGNWDQVFSEGKLWDLGRGCRETIFKGDPWVDRHFWWSLDPKGTFWPLPDLAGGVPWCM